MGYIFVILDIIIYCEFNTSVLADYWKFDWDFPQRLYRMLQ